MAMTLATFDFGSSPDLGIISYIDNNLVPNQQGQGKNIT